MIVVSILCLTYNHAPYIRQCLDGILMQKCDFEYEVLIHDDASTDGTSDIIREYQEKFGNIIKPIIQKENQFKLGLKGVNIKYNFPRVKGKYVAMCEGDDYWTDKIKLQQQVDFLERNREYSMVFSNRLIVDSEGKIIRKDVSDKAIYTVKDIVDGFIPSTQSMLYRFYPGLIDFITRGKGFYSGDRLISYYLSLHGNIYRIPAILAAYRDTGTGIWTSYDEFDRLRQHEIHLESFHKFIGFDLRDPTFAKNAFFKLYGILIYGLKHPSYFFKRKYYGLFLSIWRRYAYMNRLKLLIHATIRKLKRIFARTNE